MGSVLLPYTFTRTPATCSNVRLSIVEQTLHGAAFSIRGSRRATACSEPDGVRLLAWSIMFEFPRDLFGNILDRAPQYLPFLTS